MAVIVILAGGGGERLWPKSRVDFPKQFVALDYQKSLLQHTYELSKKITAVDKIFISTQPSMEDLIRSQLNNPQLIVEPLRRDSAAGIGYACAILLEMQIDEPVIFMGVDYQISKISAFKNCLSLACDMADEGRIATLGIVPRRIETRFGYIQPGSVISEKDGVKVLLVKGFKEKPDEDTAKEYVDNGYYWNSGMFIVKPSVLYKNIQEYMPNLYKALEKCKDIKFEKEGSKRVFMDLEKISIDYGIMELTNDLVVIEGNFEWDDIGTWDSLDRIYPLDEDRNLIRGDFDGFDLKNSIIYGDKPIIAFGLTDIIIINTEDCVFVCKKNRANEIKKIHKILKKNKTLNHLLKFENNHSK